MDGMINFFTYAHVHLGRNISIPLIVHSTGHTKETRLSANYAFSIRNEKVFDKNRVIRTTTKRTETSH